MLQLSRLVVLSIAILPFIVGFGRPALSAQVSLEQLVSDWYQREFGVLHPAAGDLQRSARGGLSRQWPSDDDGVSADRRGDGGSVGPVSDARRPEPDSEVATERARTGRSIQGVVDSCPA